MRIGVYARGGQMAAAEVVQGLQALGHRADFRRPLFKGPSDCEPFETVFVLGWKGTAKLIREQYAARDVPVVVMDSPWFGPFGADLWRLSAGEGPSWLFPAGCPSTRAEKLKALPRFTAQRVPADAPVLLCGQVPGDAAHELPSADAVAEWAKSTAADIQALLDRPVVWRPHPAVAGLAPNAAHAIPGASYSDPQQESIGEALGSCYALVTVSSGAGLDALARGVPVVATGEPAYADLAGSIRDLPKIKPPRLDQVQELFSRLAFQHWAKDELARGGGLGHFLKLAAGEEIAWPNKAAPPPEPEKPKRPAKPRRRAGGVPR